MKKIKYPYLEKKIIKPSQMLFRFNCGDMWGRKKLSRWDDIRDCIKIIIPELKKKQKNSKGKKLKKFSWIMNYTIPSASDIDDLKRNKKYIVKNHNIHTLQPIEFTRKSKYLNVFEDLLMMDTEILILLASQLDGLKTIEFWLGMLELGGLEEISDQDGYIQDVIKQKEWRSSLMDIYEPNYAAELYEDDDSIENDLYALMHLRDAIDPKIKFHCDHLDKKEQKILKKYSII